MSFAKWDAAEVDMDDTDEEMESEEIKRKKEVDAPTAKQIREHEEENHAIYRLGAQFAWQDEELEDNNAKMCGRFRTALKMDPRFAATFSS